MSATQLSPVVVEELKDLDPSKISISGKKMYTYNFKDKTTGQMTSASQPYVEVYYGQPGQKLQFLLPDMISYGGIAKASQKKAFMGFSLKKEVSDLIKQKIHEPIITQLFNNLRSLVPNNIDEFPEKQFLKLRFKGMVQKGKVRDQNTGECWNDSLACNVMMKKTQGQWTIDDNLCQVEDLDGKPYSWTALGGKNLAEVIVEVEKMKLLPDKGFSFNVFVRGIVSEEKAAPKVISQRRRRMMEMKAAEEKADQPPPAEEGQAQAGKKQRVNASSSSVTAAVPAHDSAAKNKKRMAKK